jgi:hypothetical protein
MHIYFMTTDKSFILLPTPVYAKDSLPTVYPRPEPNAGSPLAYFVINSPYIYGHPTTSQI